jgi:hypothetical protein
LERGWKEKKPSKKNKKERPLAHDKFDDIYLSIILIEFFLLRPASLVQIKPENVFIYEETKSIEIVGLQSKSNEFYNLRCENVDISKLNFIKIKMRERQYKKN